MTGGAGFAGMGRASNKNNLGMLRNRKSMGDNPYRGKKKQSRNTSNYDELKKWKQKKEQRMTTLRKSIFWSISLLVIITIITLLIS